MPDSEVGDVRVDDLRVEDADVLRAIQHMTCPVNKYTLAEHCSTSRPSYYGVGCCLSRLRAVGLVACDPTKGPATWWITDKGRTALNG